MSSEFIISAFVIGLLGAGHCFAMCGGIGAALSFAIDQHGARPARKWYLLLGYHVGRISSYSLMGALFAFSLAQLPSLFGMSWLRLLAGSMLILMGLYLAGVYMGLRVLERAGQYFWRVIQPLGRRLMPVKNPRQALLLGTVWGWLPCGLVYSALVFASAQGDPGRGALAMMAFGLGTMPATLVTGIAAERLSALLRQSWLRMLTGSVLILFGAWTILASVQHRHHDHHAPNPSGDSQSSASEHSHHH